MNLEIGIPLHPEVRAGFTLFRSESPIWIRTLMQTHSVSGREVTPQDVDRGSEGDWLITRSSEIGVGVRVADCTAILVCGLSNGLRTVGAVHAGWRGTAGGILEKFFEQISDWKDLRLWLSPSISQRRFEVGAEVLEALGSDSQEFAESTRPGKFLLDLKGLQRRRLGQLRPDAVILCSSLCTYEQPEFFSYRRDKELAGRHTAWIKIQSGS